MKTAEIDFPIDIVVTWVDGSDPKWLSRKLKFSGNTLLNKEARYRNWDLMRYWFRCIDKNMPWVHKIFFVTEGHVPEWLSFESKKLVHVKHSDYISDEDLPTFNSNVIELGVHRIQDLSEHFILFNDDMFVTRPVNPEDFFTISGQPKDMGIIQPVSPSKEFQKIPFNDMVIINRHFEKRDLYTKDILKFLSPKYGLRALVSLSSLVWSSIIGFYDPHLPISFLKSTFLEVWKAEGETLKEALTHRFRQSNDISMWLMRYWQLVSAQFFVRSKNFGTMIDLSDTIMEIGKALNSRCKVICLNDDEGLTDFEGKRDYVRGYFNENFPDISLYEIH